MLEAQVLGDMPIEIPEVRQNLPALLSLLHLKKTIDFVLGSSVNIVTVTPEDKTRYSRNRRLGEPQRLFGRFGEEKFSCPCWDSNPERPIP